MERRWSPREPFAASILLHHPAFEALSCQGKDVSMEGMAVDTGEATLPQYESMDAEITLDVGGQKETYDVNVLVVHSKEGGAVLRFQDPDIRLFRRLGDLLYSDQEQEEMDSGGQTA